MENYNQTTRKITKAMYSLLSKRKEQIMTMQQTLQMNLPPTNLPLAAQPNHIITPTLKRKQKDKNKNNSTNIQPMDKCRLVHQPQQQDTDDYNNNSQTPNKPEIWHTAPNTTDVAHLSYDKPTSNQTATTPATGPMTRTGHCDLHSPKPTNILMT